MGHWLIKSLIATTPLLNRLILLGDDIMGYGKGRPMNQFWDF